MAAPKADPAKCDVLGCGKLATTCTDGSEEDKHPRPSPDGTKRKALPNINICDHHENWPFSEDARAWAAGPGADTYRARSTAASNPPPSKKV
jgi:hypothetical protein